MLFYHGLNYNCLKTFFNCEISLGVSERTPTPHLGTLLQATTIHVPNKMQNDYVLTNIIL